MKRVKAFIDSPQTQYLTSIIRKKNCIYTTFKSPFTSGFVTLLQDEKGVGTRGALRDTILPHSTPPTFILHDIFSTTSIYHLLKFQIMILKTKTLSSSK
jgi:hypothetical protein